MSSTSRGVDFEKRVFSFLQGEIQANRFFAKPECCEIFHRKPYHSRDRLADIIFDVAIELRLPGVTTPSMVCLVECKNYDHPVPVDDIEEFFAKMQQVAAGKSKGIVATTNSFQRGALEFARSKGLGLLRLFSPGEFKWVLHRSPSSLRMSKSASRDSDVWTGLTEEQFRSGTFDFYCSVHDILTYSLRKFFAELISHDIDSGTLGLLSAEQEDTNLVPFIGIDEIERLCESVRSEIRYSGGPVLLNSVCVWQRREVGLTVVNDAIPNRQDAERGTLGRISFDPPSITVFRDRADTRRARFTLAHDLGHLLLGHGAYMLQERVDANDIENECADLEDDDIRRLEWQANYFAESLLLPRDSFLAASLALAHRMELVDRGHGLVFLDDQPVNVRNYHTFTSALMDAYGTSRAAVAVRLRRLGLLTDSQE